MNSQLTFGEYVRRRRRGKQWALQDLAKDTGLSLSHLSRLENDNSLPNADTVVKLANSLDGDLEQMLEMAKCLPKEILERLVRRADETTAHRRLAGQESIDPTFVPALIEDMDPNIRIGLAEQFRLSDQDVDGLFAVLRDLAQMDQDQREAILNLLALAVKGQRG